MVVKASKQKLELDADSPTQIPMFSAQWPRPISRDFAELSAPDIYLEVLKIAKEQKSISIAILISEEEGLRRRLWGSWSSSGSTKTNAKGLISAMTSYGWLAKEKANPDQHVLTAEGEAMLGDPKRFRRLLAGKMQQRYVIPGWFVNRLYALNPEGQGQIVLPTLLRDWEPASLDWGRKEWSKEYAFQARRSAEKAANTFIGSFPVELDKWLLEVESIWKRLGNAKRKKVAKVRADQSNAERPEVSTYSVRNRLSLAMRDATITLLFGNVAPGRHTPDFDSHKQPLPPRMYQAWCPQLDALEFIFYTDYHPLFSGRVIVPCGVFRDKAPVPPFENVPDLCDPLNTRFWIYQPTWDAIKMSFAQTLLDVYGRVAQRVGSMYVPLLEVRDEVCRQLRLSTLLFDSLLDRAYRDSIKEDLIRGQSTSISLESDVRPGEQAAVRRSRRPVYIQGVPHSLIAIASTPHN